MENGELGVEQALAVGSPTLSVFGVRFSSGKQIEVVIIHAERVLSRVCPSGSQILGLRIACLSAGRESVARIGVEKLLVAHGHVVNTQLCF
ncbi:hypothetical protein Barb6_02874 [Bacteroidales bacterium Barb6]|nr:hypothetical protein Barb6_02874 [Bacteroidales bacterium Barb6]